MLSKLPTLCYVPLLKNLYEEILLSPNNSVFRSLRLDFARVANVTHHQLIHTIN